MQIYFLRRMLKSRNNSCKRAVVRSQCNTILLLIEGLAQVLEQSVGGNRQYNTATCGGGGRFVCVGLVGLVRLVATRAWSVSWTAQPGGSLRALTTHCGGVDWSHNLKQVFEIEFVCCVMEEFERSYHSFLSRLY